MQKFTNVEIYDFQNMEFIADLSNYSDETHYTSDINDWIIDCINKKEYLINDEYNNAIENEKLSERVNVFREKYNVK